QPATTFQPDSVGSCSLKAQKVSPAQAPSRFMKVGNVPCRKRRIEPLSVSGAQTPTKLTFSVVALPPGRAMGSRTLTKADLLILDDWGPDRFTASQRRDLMEIVEDRYGAGSTLITWRWMRCT